MVPLGTSLDFIMRGFLMTDSRSALGCGAAGPVSVSVSTGLFASAANKGASTGTMKLFLRGEGRFAIVEDSGVGVTSKLISWLSLTSSKRTLLTFLRIPLTRGGVEGLTNIGRGGRGADGGLVRGARETFTKGTANRRRGGEGERIGRGRVEQRSRVNHREFFRLSGAILSVNEGA